MDRFKAMLLDLVIAGDLSACRAASILDAQRVVMENTPVPYFHGTGNAYSTIFEVASLMSGNQKIPAIKLYRTTFNVGLKLAKDACEAIDDMSKGRREWNR